MGPRKKKKTELKSKQHNRVTHFAWFSLRLFKSIQRDYRNISDDAPKMGTKFVGAQKPEISISADEDFGEMKKTATPSKSRRVGRYAMSSAKRRFMIWRPPNVDGAVMVV